MSLQLVETAPESEEVCSFCGRTDDEAGDLVHGVVAKICQRCTASAVRIFLAREGDAATGTADDQNWADVSADDLRSALSGNRDKDDG